MYTHSQSTISCTGRVFMMTIMKKRKYIMLKNIRVYLFARSFFFIALLLELSAIQSICEDTNIFIIECRSYLSSIKCFIISYVCTSIFKSFNSHWAFGNVPCIFTRIEIRRLGYLENNGETERLFITSKNVEQTSEPIFGSEFDMKAAIMSLALPSSSNV